MVLCCRDRRGRAPSPSAGHGERHLRVSRGAAAGRRPAGRRRTATMGRDGATARGGGSQVAAPPPTAQPRDARSEDSRLPPSPGPPGRESGSGEAAPTAQRADIAGAAADAPEPVSAATTDGGSEGNRRGAGSVIPPAGRHRAVGGTESPSCHDNVKTDTTESLGAPQLLARRREAAGTESRGGEGARWENVPAAPPRVSGARPVPGGTGKPSTSARPGLPPPHLSAARGR